MKAIRSFLLSIASIIISMITSIVVMIKGWGLEPESWNVIIIGSLFGYTVSAIFLYFAKEDTDV